ncbi:MAG: hypothetical protein BGO01_21380 [Armatimonadetes bacterium 55-13]|nr:hypothetical protein [Armatimonadota bacterium]OJU64659.1 MAG: hypothetical protein BGO01_21380 [Armatimonadetes bacterium 55-13]
MNRPAIPIWLLPCIALTALASGYSILKRHQVESKNKAVTIAVEYETVEALAASQGESVDKALLNLKEQGLGALVLGEETVYDLIAEGYANLTGNELTLRQDRVVSSTKAVEALADRVKQGLKTRFNDMKVVTGQEGEESVVRVEFASPSLIRQTAIGLNPSVAQLAQKANLGIICRLSNPTGVTSTYVTESLKWAKSLGASVFLPQGDQVLGRRNSLDATVKALQANGMLYASPEFTKIGGDANVLAEAPEIVVRLHSAQTAELDKLPLADAIDRYAKAARERNMRILLVRPVTNASPNPLNDFAEFIKSINDEIRKEGGDMGVARPFEDSEVPSILKLVIALTVIPTAYFVITSLFGFRTPAYVLTGLFALVCLASFTNSGRPFAALAAAMVFPIASFLILDGRDGKHILPEFLLVCAVSLVGGLAVAGMLNGLPYFVKASEFKGIKVAVFAPIFVVGYYLAARYVDLKAAMRNPITWGAALLSIAVLVALMFMNSRTGNDNPAGVSDLELKFRNILDAVLFVRPRTKSFLIGHPMLIVGIGMLLWQRKKNVVKLAPWTALVLTIGAIGQTDIVNTLCHIHTPVALSLLRNCVALVPGCIIGFLAWGLVRRSLAKGEGEALQRG